MPALRITVTWDIDNGHPSARRVMAELARMQLKVEGLRYKIESLRERKAKTFS
jgi:hypothetical protein